MTEKIRILAEATAMDPSNRFGVPGDYRDTGRTLQSYIDLWGGFEGTIPSPFGGPQQVSLAAFADHPRDIYIDIRFVEPWDGWDLPPDYSDAVILKEFEV
ncbi:hypothetical protein [Nocardia arizonensis]|uniref:hypothetical protein n=1 Tax=Nocardia arizonensis TaxID=1141647 RepID=UPI000ABDFEC6|nr:hypothetical protein [Nocardia arizonensis]